MLTRSLVVATAVLAFAAIPLSAVQAKSNNSHGNSSANHQGLQGNNSASVKSGNSSGTHSGSTKSTQAQAKQKKKPRTSPGPIIFTKHYDKSSP
jgi:hypothetical protein